MKGSVADFVWCVQFCLMRAIFYAMPMSWPGCCIRRLLSSRRLDSCTRSLLSSRRLDCCHCPWYIHIHLASWLLWAGSQVSAWGKLQGWGEEVITWSTPCCCLHCNNLFSFGLVTKCITLWAGQIRQDFLDWAILHNWFGRTQSACARQLGLGPSWCWWLRAILAVQSVY